MLLIQETYLLVFPFETYFLEHLSVSLNSLW